MSSLGTSAPKSMVISSFIMIGERLLVDDWSMIGQWWLLPLNGPKCIFENPTHVNINFRKRWIYIFANMHFQASLIWPSRITGGIPQVHFWRSLNMHFGLAWWHRVPNVQFWAFPYMPYSFLGCSGSQIWNFEGYHICIFVVPRVLNMQFRWLPYIHFWNAKGHKYAILMVTKIAY